MEERPDRLTSNNHKPTGVCPTVTDTAVNCCVYQSNQRSQGDEFLTTLTEGAVITDEGQEYRG